MCFLIILTLVIGFGQSTMAQTSPKGHPNTSGVGWEYLFETNLTNASFPKGVWRMDEGELTATDDKPIWTNTPYDDFILDLQFKTADGTNSGVVVHASDTANWIPNSVEIQIADDYAKEWAEAPANWRCGSFFGHQPATKSAVKKPGEWNRYTITCQGKMIYVVLNNQLVNTIDLSQFISATVNPDGTKPPAWFSKAPATLPLHGFIGLQGKHAGAPIYYRNLKIKPL